MKNNFKIHIIRTMIIFLLIALWEFLSKHNYINPFIFSSPSKILNCILYLYKSNNLFIHINTTLNETVIAFILCVIFSFIISLLFYIFGYVFKIVEPLLTMLNSMPKVALGPVIILIFGAKENSVIIMALSITLILNILNIYNGFKNTDSYLEKYLNTLHVTKFQKIKLLVIPSSYSTIINNLKINISMTLIGVIMGEFLVSKAGIGYLIIYGTQVFNLTLVMSGIVILMIISYVLYILIGLLEKILNKKISNQC